MKKIIILPVVFALSMSGCAVSQYSGENAGFPIISKNNADIAEEPLKRTLFAMDTVMDFTIYGGNEDVLDELENEVKRIESILSKTNPKSEIYKFNSGEKFNLSDETKLILNDSLEICSLTDGIFDISIAPMMELWGFVDKNFKVPSQSEISQTLKLVDYKKIVLNDDGSFEKPENVQIDLGGIAKGYTSDRLIEIMKRYNAVSGIVSLGGNVQALGKRPDGRDFRVGIQDPFEADESAYVAVVSISDKAVVTSGGYQRYFEENGKKYHHIIDTSTGYPAENSLASVSIICESGELADGLSTSLFVMGLENGSKFWRGNSEKFDAVFVDNVGNIYVTEGLEGYFESNRSYEIISRNHQ